MHFLWDFRFSFRIFRKNLGLTLAVIVILAISIGATTAVFTVANALLLRPFPYLNPSQLVAIQIKDQGKDYDGTLLRYELLRDRRRRAQHTLFMDKGVLSEEPESVQ